MHRYTLTITKEHDLAFLGHRDWSRTLVRALRRAGLPLFMTEGFHPHPKMVLPEPLPLGVASEGERFVVLLTEPWPVDRILAAVAPCLPEAMVLCAVEEGVHRDDLDAPVELFLGSPEPRALQEEVRLLGAREELGLAEVTAETVPGGVQVRLTPPAGRRVSVGRLLRGLRDSGHGPAEVRRCIPCPRP